MSRASLVAWRSSWRTERAWRGVVARERGGELRGVGHGGQGMGAAESAVLGSSLVGAGTGSGGGVLGVLQDTLG